jgi:GGDEF domain-containing protein
VLRLLDKQAGRLDLTRLGMDDDTLAQVDRLIREPHGIVLVTGPTGSGKTTTLYSALSRLDAKSLNIMTVEDPIEYDLDGIPYHGSISIGIRIYDSNSATPDGILKDADTAMYKDKRSH